MKKTSQNRSTGGLTLCLAEEQSMWERSVAEKRHAKNAEAVKEKLTKQIKQLSVRVIEREG